MSPDHKTLKQQMSLWLPKSLQDGTVCGGVPPQQLLSTCHPRDCIGFWSNLGLVYFWSTWVSCFVAEFPELFYRLFDAFCAVFLDSVQTAALHRCCLSLSKPPQYWQSGCWWPSCVFLMLKCLKIGEKFALCRLLSWWATAVGFACIIVSDSS